MFDYILKNEWTKEKLLKKTRYVGVEPTTFCTLNKRSNQMS